ncbi:MAG: hypothetical protein JNJ77_10535 [Planctomycetia bacterium]|nr:hypothetical protein [Planctomycetia bacterium]
MPFALVRYPSAIAEDNRVTLANRFLTGQTPGWGYGPIPSLPNALFQEKLAKGKRH